MGNTALARSAFLLAAALATMEGQEPKAPDKGVPIRYAYVDPTYETLPVSLEPGQVPPWLSKKELREFVRRLRWAIEKEGTSCVVLGADLGEYPLPEWVKATRELIVVCEREKIPYQVALFNGAEHRWEDIRYFARLEAPVTLAIESAVSFQLRGGRENITFTSFDKLREHISAARKIGKAVTWRVLLRKSAIEGDSPVELLKLVTELNRDPAVVYQIYLPSE